MADLTTLVNAKAWLGLTDTTDDTLLTRLVSAVSAAAESRMGRSIALHAYTVTLNGSGKCVLAFPDRPVATVTSVTVDGVAIPPSSGPGAAGYQFDQSFLYLVGYEFTRGRQNVVLQYNAGLSSTPLDLEQAVLDIIAFKYKERDRIGQSSKILAGETIGFFRDVPPDALRVIDDYGRVLAP